MPTLQEAVSSKFGDSAWNLLNDAGEAASVRKSIGYCIVGDDQIITNMPFEQVKMALSVAKFATDDEEVVYVARMVFVTVGKTNILPMISCHRGFDLASRCLVALSLFKKALDHRTKFRGCPWVVHRTIGIQTVTNEGMDSVAEHFDDWTSLVGETMCG